MGLSKNMSNPADAAIGNRVRRLRESVGVTASELAGRLKIGTEELLLLENGRGRLGSTLLDAISRVFEVTVWSFFDSAGDAEEENEDVSVASIPSGRLTLH